MSSPVSIQRTEMIKIAEIIKTFFTSLNVLKIDRRILYRLSSIDIEKQTAVLHVISKNIFIKLTFAEIISDSEVIEGFSCREACWMGAYYGQALRAAVDGKTHLRNIKKPVYLLKHKYGQYKIICENRDGTIGCLHIKTRKELTIHPLSIAQDDLFIKQFDANQACYIGILAGMAMKKKQNASDSENKKPSAPYLRVVK